MNLQYSLAAVFLLFMSLECARGAPGSPLPSPQTTEIRSPSSATPARSADMSDREKAGLRGPVHTCVEEAVYPTGKFSTTHTYDIDGKLLVSRSSNSDGSEWVTTWTYDSDDRLISRVSGNSGKPGLQSLDSYDDSGRLLSITNNLSKGDRINFRYDAQGRKSSIQSFAPESLERKQNTSFDGSPWAAAQLGFGVPAGGNVTTFYDQNDQPTEEQILDAEGQIVSRIVRTYGANGQLSEEKPTFENLAPVMLERMPAEQRDQMSPDQIKALSKQMAFMMAGKVPAGTTYSYDSQNRLIASRERNMIFEKTTSITYNEQGDKAEERTTYAENSVIPVGTVLSVGENGELAPSEPAAQPQPSPPSPEPTLIRYAYQYDGYGNWTQQISSDTTHPTRPPTSRNRTLTYY